MKIVQITPQYTPNIGGVETHVESISERLAERGHEVVVLTADRGRDVPTTEYRNGVQIRRHRSFAPGGAFHIAPTITPSIRRNDGDIIHAHNYHSLPALFAAVGVNDSRFVVTPHYHGESASGLRNRLIRAYQPLGRWMLNNADEIVAVSNWERKRLADDLGVNATVIPNGIDVVRFGNASAVNRSGEYLLCVGRLVRYKGVQHAVRALNDLPKYDLLVVGSGPFRSDLERLAELCDVADRVEFLGEVSDKDLPGLYAGAAAYLNFSEFEAFGMTVGEALSGGTPCVVRDAAALSDWSDNEGVVIVDELSPTIVTLAVEQAVGREPSAWGVISWDEVVDDLVQIYSSEGKENKHMTADRK